MAMRPRTPTFRARPAVRPVYQTFQPKSEMKENPEAYVLHVYLPGFTRERIKISYVGASRMVRILGEQPIGGNRWSKFDQTYPVPENCVAEALQAKFELGTLILTMPKSISQVSPKPEVKTTQEKAPPSPSEKLATEAKLEKAQETISPESEITTKVEEPIGDKKSDSIPSPVKGPSDLKEQKAEDEKGLRTLVPTEPIRDGGPQKGQEGIVKRTMVTTGKPQKGKKEFEPKATQTMATKIQTDEKAQKGQEGVEPKPKLTTVTRDTAEEKLEDVNRLKTKLARVKKELEGKTAEKERVSKKEVREDGKPYDVEKGVFEEKEIRTRRVSPKEAEPSGIKAPEKRKEDMIDTVGNGIRAFAASASQVVARVAEGKLNEEEKHLAVNMGAAVLVIAALGVYVSYRFSSSGRTEN